MTKLGLIIMAFCLVTAGIVIIKLKEKRAKKLQIKEIGK